jgi:hypothetical protein
MPKKDLMTVPKGAVPAAYDDELFDKTAKSGDWLPRFQLMTSNSTECKDGKFPINHFALVRDQKFTDLGDRVSGLIAAWRPKALEIDEEITTNYDPNSDEFKRISEESLKSDSNAMYGPEFLLWLPEPLTFATFFMCTKSMRRTSGDVKALMNNGGTFTPKKIVTKKYTWFSPVVEACTTPFKLPDGSELLAQYNKFMQPEVEDKERVKDGEKSGRER